MIHGLGIVCFGITAGVTLRSIAQSLLLTLSLISDIVRISFLSEVERMRCATKVEQREVESSSQSITRIGATATLIVDHFGGNGAAEF